MKNRVSHSEYRRGNQPHGSPISRDPRLWGLLRPGRSAVVGYAGELSAERAFRAVKEAHLELTVLNLGDAGVSSATTPVTFTDRLPAGMKATGAGLVVRWRAFQPGIRLVRTGAARDGISRERGDVHVAELR